MQLSYGSIESSDLHSRSSFRPAAFSCSRLSRTVQYPAFPDGYFAAHPFLNFASDFTLHVTDTGFSFMPVLCHLPPRGFASTTVQENFGSGGTSG